MCFLLLVYDKLQLAVLTRSRMIPKEATLEPVLTVACSLEHWACGGGVQGTSGSTTLVHLHIG